MRMLHQCLEHAQSDRPEKAALGGRRCRNRHKGKAEQGDNEGLGRIKTQKDGHPTRVDAEESTRERAKMQQPFQSSAFGANPQLLKMRRTGAGSVIHNSEANYYDASAAMRRSRRAAKLD